MEIGTTPEPDEVLLPNDLTEDESESGLARDGAEETGREFAARDAAVEKTEASEADGVEAMEAFDERPWVAGTEATETTGREELAEVLVEMLTGGLTEMLAEDFDAEVFVVRGLDCCWPRGERRAQLATVACM